VVQIAVWAGWVGCAPGVPVETGDTGPTEPVTWMPQELPRDTLVVPEDDGITFLTPSGRVVLQAPWNGLVGPCPVCGGEGASPDGDGLLVSFTTSGTSGIRPGAIARLRGSGELDFRVDGFRFPHDVVRDPADGTLIVVATSSNALYWIAGDGSSDAPLRSLTSDHPDFPSTPNGAELLQHDGRTYLLLSHRPIVQGRITMWDITTPGEPMFQWRFPAEGALGVPHGPILREVDGRHWLLWAHTEGAIGDTGSVGLAVTDHPATAPTYVADLVPDEPIAPFRFLRGVELLEGARLILTDSGSQGFGPGRGRIVEAGLPDLPTPATGEIGRLGDQIFRPLGEAEILLDPVPAPFEAWLWSAP